VVRQPNGCWSSPVFITMTGGSIGWQAGIQSTDVVLVFKTRNSLDRILAGKGKFTLGADAAVAAGPVGRQAEAGTDAELKAEIFSYSRSRGLFLGLSVEGAAILVDHEANQGYYRIARIRPGDVATMQGPGAPEVERLKAQLARMTMSEPPPVVVPLPPPPPPVVNPPDLPFPRPLPPPPPR
jgi:lipid-binding SYLF domain-containing protein